MNIAEYLKSRKELIDRYLLKYLPSGNMYTRTLYRAMKYSTMARSKRIRPVLVLAACEAFGKSMELAMPTACALEFIHTYTLIHDDLPAMDDDDWRRGKPSCHRVFGEDVAILSGDALSALAIRTITEKTSRSVKRERVISMIDVITEALMDVVGGQIADLKFERRKFGKKELEFIHLNKTAALIKASVVSGGIIGGASSVQLKKLAGYGENLGLAFQMIDDILDMTSSRKMLGKTPGKDLKQKKATYPRLVGMDQARKMAKGKIDKAIKSLQGLGKRFIILRQIAAHLGERCV